MVKALVKITFGRIFYLSTDFRNFCDTFQVKTFGIQNDDMIKFSWRCFVQGDMQKGSFQKMV